MRRIEFILFSLALIAGLLFSACSQSTSLPAQNTMEAASPPPETTVELTQPTEVTTPLPSITPATEETTPDETDGTEIVIEDGLGRTVILPEPAQRIASLAPSNTEILYAIGAGPQVVGRDMFSDFPAEAQQAADIGGGFGELNTELLVSLEPDLVLASELTPPEQAQALEELGVKVFFLKTPKQFEEMYENLIIVGQLTGHEDQAKTLAEELKDRVAAVEEKLAGVTEIPVVFYELDSTDPNAPWTSGPGTFIDMLLQRAGGQNLGNILESEWAQISLEELIAQDPDIILLGDFTWGGVTAEDVMAREGWGDLTAVKEGRVFPFDDNLVARPGPRLVDGIEALAKLLHPDLIQ